MHLPSYKLLTLFIVLLIQTAAMAQAKRVRTIVGRVDSTSGNFRHKTHDSLSTRNHSSIRGMAIDSLHEPRRRSTRSYRSDTTDTSIVRKRRGVLHLKEGIRHKRHSLQGLRTRKVVVKLACKPDAILQVDNVINGMDILTSDNNQVMLVAIVKYMGQSILTDDEWLSKLNVSLGGDEENIFVKSGISPTDEALTNNAGPIATLFDSLGNPLENNNAEASHIVLYVPKNASIKLDSRYADITFTNTMKKVDAKITNGQLTLNETSTLLLKAAYASVHAKKLLNASMDIQNGSLKADSVYTLSISSKNSSVEVDRVDVLTINNSEADTYNFGQVKTITGKKAFGDFRLATLTGSVALNGENTSMQIKLIQPSVSAITIRSKYAKLHLPVKQLKNYQLALEGPGSTIQSPAGLHTITASSYKAASRNSNQKATQLLLNCANCTVDFN